MQLLPSLDKQDIFDVWNAPENQLVLSANPTVLNPDMVQRLSFMICPSSEKNDARSVAVNSYISNNGFCPREADPAPFNELSYPFSDAAVP